MIEMIQRHRIIEAALFAAGKPLNMIALQQLFLEEESVESADIKASLNELQALYADRGLALVELASGYTFRVSADLGPWVSRLWTEKPVRYSRAFLETLAMIAYRQPITRGEIEAIRGVTVNTQAIKTLQEREWIRVVGHKEVPGKPALYATTPEFLDYFGLKSLTELPTLMPLQGIPLDNMDEESKALAIAAEAAMESGINASVPEPLVIYPSDMDLQLGAELRAEGVYINTRLR